MIEQDLKLTTTHLQRLSIILNYELSTLAVFLLSFKWGITLLWLQITVVVVAAILFAPYLIFVLIKEKRYGWIIFFVILVILPMIIIFLFLSDSTFYLALLLIQVLLFYFYCFILRMTVGDWIKKQNWKEFRETQESQKNNNDDFIVLK